MDTENRKYITIIALENLIRDYTIALEDKELNLSANEREIALYIISEAKSMLWEMGQELQEPTIKRPQWKNQSKNS